VADLNPLPMRRVRLRMRKMCVMRAVIRQIKLMNCGEPLRSFIPRSDANGYCSRLLTHPRHITPSALAHATPRHTTPSA
jgi:hypothetical protein